jgi:cytochrome c oxidase cbb3-type subunit 3
MGTTMADKIDRDEVTGTETTGHEWDGIKELDTPLPRWWLYIFYGSIVVAVIYWVLMPAWPLANGYTQGLLNWSDRRIVAAEVQRVGNGACAHVRSLGARECRRFGV